MDRNDIQTGLKPGQHEEFRTYWGWSILAPACPGWVYPCHNPALMYFLLL
jgi:hypothetical protein